MKKANEVTEFTESDEEEVVEYEGLLGIFSDYPELVKINQSEIIDFLQNNPSLNDVFRCVSDDDPSLFFLFVSMACRYYEEDPSNDSRRKLYQLNQIIKRFKFFKNK